ncbi:MAG: GGDEF domain-containing protein [Betaproteobacteria bacterium]|nr:GGDEF domain-containing protein [Betaproteobacteria bacterium]
MLGRLFKSSLEPDGSQWADQDWQRERDLLCHALMGCAQDLPGATSSEATVQRMAERLLECSRHLRLIWFWHGPADADTVKPQVACGPARDYADSLSISRAALAQTGGAFRMLAEVPEAGRPLAASPFTPWQAPAERHGFKAALATPLRLDDGLHSGVIALHADKADYFEKVGLDLFTTLGRFGEVALQLEQLHRVARAAANADPLTALLNRRGMQEQLARVVDQHRSEMSTRLRRSHLLLIDIDYFRQVNEYYGQPAADRLIVEMARLFSQNLRQNDLISRWGGQEFLVVLANQTEDVVKQVAERLRLAISNHPFRVGEEDLQVSVSIGVAAYAPEFDSPEAWINQTVAALQKAKQQGRNRVCWSAT